MCSGYYRYAQGYVPALPGEASFAGPVIHPQQWPEGLDYTGKRVVIIGSGATAVTLVPAMAGQARHVTMLQRSPSYLYPRASQDAIINALRAVFPEKIAYALGRLKNTTMQVYNFLMARAFPQFVGNAVVKLVRERLPAGFDVEKHFRPSYGPWVQRVCLVPDDDFFQAIQAGKASVVTDSITALTPDGITLASGERLAADIIIKATGLELEVAGGVPIRVDGRLIDFAETLTYKGVMYSGVPNFATVFGYLAASWTMRADLIAQYVCRLLRHMEAYGQAVVMPPPRDPHQPTRPLFDFTSGYIQRSLPKLPRQGPAAPWQQSQHYWVDIWRLRLAPVDDGVLQFSRPPAGATDSRIEPAPAAAA
jgi:cation diffusion facilitator CzcD-associated flavoprotein CzcO